MLITLLRISVFTSLVCGWSPRIVAAPPPVVALDLPDTPLVDQDGKPVRFKSDLLGQKTVAINFVFTTCNGICPILGTTFSKLQERLGERLGKDIELISISIDPAFDTPARMKQWGKQFGARPGWRLLTGERSDIVGLLKALEATNHDTPVVLLGRPSTGEWERTFEEANAPDKLYDRLIELADKPSPAKRYFGDVVLIDQNGEKLRLYEDPLKGRVVVMNAFYSDCQGVCSVLLPKLAELQTAAGERLGKDVSFLSISVDPLTDTPEKLKTYAQGLKAKPGWHFLTGDRKAVDEVLQKFGQAVDDKENHSNLLIMGNDRTGLWKKVMGLAPIQDITTSFRSVANDEGAAKP